MLLLEAQCGCAAQPQEEIVSEEFGNNPEVVFNSSVSTCPSLAAGLELDETVERNEQSDDKQDACHDLEDTGIEMESEESNLPIERVEGPGEERMGIGNVTNPGSAAGGDSSAKWKRVSSRTERRQERS